MTLTDEERAQAIAEAKQIATQHATAVVELLWSEPEVRLVKDFADPRFKALIDFTIDAYKAAFQAAANRLLDARPDSAR